MFLAFRRRHQHLARPNLVDHVDRFVRELAIADVARGELYGAGVVLQTEALFESANEPKRLRWTNGRHIGPDREEIIAELFAIADEELEFLTQPRGGSALGMRH